MKVIRETITKIKEVFKEEEFHIQIQIPKILIGEPEIVEEYLSVLYYMDPDGHKDNIKIISSDYDYIADIIVITGYFNIPYSLLIN